MNHTDDRELLRRYAEQGDEVAFGEVVRRYVDFVYGCAVRRLAGDRHAAEDVTQQVFSDLAKRADEVSRHVALAGWLHTSTRFAAAHVVRAEQRRRLREQALLTMNATEGEPTADEAWSKLRPVLDDTIDGLEERDRAAVVWRFFEGRSFADIAEQLRLNENAARMRVERALEKLQRGLAQRGIRSTATALAAAMASQAAATAPVGLATSVTSAALAVGVGGAAAGAAAVGSFMSMTTLQIGLSGVLAVAGATGFVLEARNVASLENEVAELRKNTAVIRTLEAENLQLRRLAGEVAAMQRDDAELTRLGAEAATLRTRAQQLAREEQARAATTVFDISKLDTTPRPRFQARPDYPLEMKMAKISGEVVVDFVVDTNGAVQDAKAIRSSRSEFEAYAVAAVQKWKFAPGKKGGRDVATHLQVPIVFTVDGGAKEPAAAAPKPATSQKSAGESVQLDHFNVHTK